MLTRIAASKTSVRLLKNQARSIITVPGKNFIVPESDIDIMNYLDERKPEFTCLYFHAAWNPICKRIE